MYAIWMPMLGGDARNAIPDDVLVDPRVARFWDPKRTMGTWFAERNIGDQPILWDAYLLFGPDAKWNNKPSPLAAGDPILGTTRQLAKAVTKIATAEGTGVARVSRQRSEGPATR